MDWSAPLQSMRRFAGLFNAPLSCVVCGSAADTNLCLCTSCAAALPYSGTACHRCAIPLIAQDAVSLCCGTCSTNPPLLDHCAAVFCYDTPVRQLISAFKFQGNLAEGRVFGRLMAQAMERHYGSSLKNCVLLPVPLHPYRLRHRGFNQAVLLARCVNKQLGIPVALNLVQRRLDTPAQSQLDKRQRHRNLHDAFQIAIPSKAAGFARVIIIDDVMTTLSTVSVLAKTLREAGVVQVDAWAVARAHKTPGAG